jgi:hypothetical protein
VTGQCHTANMRDPAQYLDSTRNCDDEQQRRALICRMWCRGFASASRAWNCC